MTSVLVVDDRAADRELVSTVLSHAGYAVLEAATGEKGIELAQTESPDLIIVDILMPTMDGYAFVHELRSRAGARAIRVVFYTATYALEEVRRLGAGAGVTHILIKPCEPEDIMRVVGEALSSGGAAPPALPSEEFHQEHLRVLNEALIRKVDELEAATAAQAQLHEQLRVAQRDTAASLTLLETFQSAAPVGFGFVDRDFRLSHMNESLAAVSGVPLEQQLGRTVAEAVPGLWSQIEPIFRSVLENGEPVLNQEIAGGPLSGPGDTRCWLANYYPVLVNGVVMGIGLVVIDITERKQAEGFRSVVMDNMAEGLCAMDVEGRLMFMNAAASKILGWTEEELRGKSVHAAFHFQRADGSAYPEDECEIRRVGVTGQPVRIANDGFTRKDGSLVPVAYSASPLLSGSNVEGTVVVFHDITEEKADQARMQRELNALTWVGRIREALDEGRFVLYSQPIVSLTDGNLYLEELLLRMVGRNGEIIPPASFLPAAEKYGFIGEIDHWVISEAFRLAAGGRRITVNVSADTVGGPHLLALVERELRVAGADPSLITFEITETALMADADAGQACARGLADMGFGVALDDFGTGFGSFTYLKNLPIDYLKIDIEFVRELVSSEANRHVIKAIVSLAQGFGQRTIAEGVEDVETLELLREYGVDFAQGYHLGIPAAIEAPASGAPVSDPDRRGLRVVGGGVP
jgi:PAS domain S-box-containing protein